MFHLLFELLQNLSINMDYFFSLFCKYHLDPFHLSVIVSIVVILLTFLAFSSNDRVSINPKICVVIITGCDSGFGLATALKLTSQGYLVISTCMTKDGIDRLRNVVEVVIYCDVTNEENVQALYKETNEYLQKHKGTELWTLVNNAGVIANGYVDWMSMDIFRNVMEVNYFAPIRLVKQFLPLLKRSRGSRIINICSVAGMNSSALLGPYAGSKHALEGIGKSMREELAPWNIHVCHINPGVMK